MEATSGQGSRRRPVVVTMAALGVVFGDIGTSPLYALRTVFENTGSRPLPVDRTTVYGVISAIIWSLTLIVSILYVRLMTHADNDGEGGLLALLALLRRQHLSARSLALLFALGVFGAALFFGDSLITPAISVLSAVGGLETVDSGFKDFVVPGAVAILFTLIAVQRWGTGRIGGWFGPIMACWFVVIAVFGMIELLRDPAILQAVSPHWAIRFFAADPLRAFLALGGIVLVVTGAEALYADIGHFGRRPIARSWMLLVFPAITLNYLGQGALVLRRPRSVHDPFFLLIPHWALVPTVVLATVATVIASQAVITGAFSVSRQAARLGYLPRLRVIHTSESQPGQVYLPFVNGVLMVGVLGLVLGFRSSSRLTSAYGVAVIGTITISTVLFFALQYLRRDWPRWWVFALAAVFLVVDLLFLTANSAKIPDGGWLPVGIGVVFFGLLTTWHRGREMAERVHADAEDDLDEFVEAIHEGKYPIQRVPGCAVFLSREKSSTPLALRGNVKHNHALHESTILLTFRTESVAHVASTERVVVDRLTYQDDGISQVTATLGYFDKVSVPTLLREAIDEGLESREDDVDNTRYFVSIPELRVTDAAGMARWRKHLFVAMTRLTSDPAEFFDLPLNKTIVVGAEVDI